jgi:beta-lactam-binding protein with PASTA domain
MTPIGWYGSPEDVSGLSARLRGLPGRYAGDCTRGRHRCGGEVWQRHARRLGAVDTTVTDPLDGATLDGRYRIRGRIARGGMATVYHALDTRLERTVAVKLLHPAYASDPAFAERFVREARSIARLSHPNVVAVYDQGTYDDQAFLVMEYVKGRTLRDVLTERGRLSPPEAVGVLEAMLDALSAAHRIGMIHRDVKPENVLVGDDGSVKVADFGLARVVDAGHNTATRGVLMGTVAYVPPELVTTGKADPRSDVYAAGIVLYEMLTGTVPFRGETALSVAWQHVNADVPPPSEVIGGLPVPLDELTLHATRREPGARPTDAGAFLAELRDVRADLGLPQMAPPPRAEQPQRTQPTIAVPRGDLLADADEVPGPAPAGPPVPGRAGLLRGSAAVPVPGAAADPAVDPGPAAYAASAAEPPVEPPDRGPRRPIRRGPLALAIVLVLGLLIAATGWYLGVGQYTQAPSVLRKTQAQAEAILRTAGLKAGLGDRAYSEDVPVGSVVEQDPAPNGRVRRDGTVRLVLSRGPERHDVPAVTGRSQADAEAAVRAATLRPLVRQAYSDTVPRGRVVSAAPKAGSSVRRDTVVTLVVSKGPPPVSLPDVTGRPVADVTRDLTAKGLVVTVKEEFSETVANGLVISQQPRPGTVLKGSTVTLVASKGQPFVDVPDVRGKSFADAQTALAAVGLVAQRGFDIPGGDNTVLNQSPGAGDSVRKGSKVTLYLF